MLRFLRERRLRARGLFPYWDGIRRRWGDPFAIYRLLASGEAKLPDLADAVDQGKEPETSQAIEIITKAFDVRRWDGRAGLIDNEILALIGQLDGYIDEVKKKRNIGLI